MEDPWLPFNAGIDNEVRETQYSLNVIPVPVIRPMEMRGEEMGRAIPLLPMMNKEGEPG